MITKGDSERTIAMQEVRLGSPDLVSTIALVPQRISGDALWPRVRRDDVMDQLAQLRRFRVMSSAVPVHGPTPGGM